MKKVFTFSFFIFFLASCSSENLRIGPSGVTYQATEEVEEATPGYEEDVDAEANPIEMDEVKQLIIEETNVLNLSMRPPQTLNPLLNEDITVARILRLMFEPLVIIDNEFRVINHLAELEFASDFSFVMVNIRNDAIWSDGRPVTSDDLIYSVEVLRNSPVNVIYHQNAQNIIEIVQINSKSVQRFFHVPSFLAVYDLAFPIIPINFNKKNPIGNGSFIFHEKNTLRSITLVSNPLSFRGRALIDKIEVVFLPDSETDLFAFDRARIDVKKMPLTQWSRHHSAKTPNYEIIPAMDFEFIGFNFNDSTFRDVHVRQGIAHIFNIEEAFSAIYMSHGVSSISPIHPYNWASSSESNMPVFDPSRGTALLGNVSRASQLTILVNDDNLQRVSIAERLSNSLNEIGISSKVESVSNEEYFRRLDVFDFDLFIGGVTLPFAPSMGFLQNHGNLFLQDHVLANSFSNILVASTENAYLQAIAAFEKIFAERLPVIGLGFRHTALLSNERLIGSLNPMPDHIFANTGVWEFR